MTAVLRIAIIALGATLFLVILELVRRKKFREELSIVWLFIGMGLIASSFADKIIDPLAFALGISYPPTLMLVMVVFLLVLVILYFSIIVSDLKGKNKELSQKIALIEYKLESRDKQKT